jgi:hypothetical protein
MTAKLAHVAEYVAILHLSQHTQDALPEPGTLGNSRAHEALPGVPAGATELTVTDTDRPCALSNSDKAILLGCLATAKPASALHAKMKPPLVELWRWAMATVVRIDASGAHRTGRCIRDVEHSPVVEGGRR